jgi:hypothetical protein
MNSEKILSTKPCQTCQAKFSVTDIDQKFFKKFDVPESENCPDCRQQLRLLQVNHSNLFKRRCDGSNKEVISNFAPDSPFKVYSQEYWLSDEYDPKEYAQDVDFNRPFFDQLKELSDKIPRPALFSDYIRDENSEYTNYAGKNKNCYLIFDSDENHDCMYCFGTNTSRDCLDCDRIVANELCYEALDSKKCYKCSYIQDCENCNESMMLKNCIGCKNCIFCSNLQHKEYHVFNEPVSKERYEEIMKDFGSYKYLQEKLQIFQDFILKFPQKYMRGFQNENCSGNYLVNCKNASNCFECQRAWDEHNCSRMFTNSKDCMDCDECGEVELLYECNVVVYNCYNIRFSSQCVNQCANLDYCIQCNTSKDCFGCVGMKKAQYCIFNKQYSEEEYKEMLPKLIEYMRKTGEWGKQIPASISEHPYNLTLAQVYYPLTKEQALAQNFAWRDPDPKEYQAQTYQTPDHINDVDDSITDEVLACKECTKNFKVMPNELAFYRSHNLPIPKKCHNCRHLDRLDKRLTRHLHDRQCVKCQADIETTYAPDRPEVVHCEKCYLESLN